MQCIDSLVQKVQSGVVINFEKIGPDPPPIDSSNNRDGSEQNDDITQETDKEIDGEGDRNGVSVNLLYMQYIIYVWIDKNYLRIVCVLYNGYGKRSLFINIHFF